MKIINKGAVPNRLGAFKAAHPEALWEKTSDVIGNAFRCCSARYQETQQQLRTDQGNICAYCEQDLLSGTNGELDDCRIEHFHPKSNWEPGQPNWALEWTNLLVVCCGGNQKDVVNPEHRFEPDSRNHTCDVPKGHKVLDEVIFNPLNLPNFNIWSFKRSTGSISVNEDLCTFHGLDIQMAHQTIVELNLNSPRLMRARKTILDNLNNQISQRLNSGQTIEQARSFLAASVLRRNETGDWPSFFSATRFYLGRHAEQVLVHSL